MIKCKILFIIFILSCLSHSQTINIHTKDGQIDEYNISEIDSIMFTVVIDSVTTGTVTDIDGNIYKTVKIGNQWWMAENLKVTHYRNGDPIDHVTDDTEWTNLSTGAWCVYDNQYSNKDIYGLLYNWYAVSDSRNIAPDGWLIPTHEDWKELVDYLGGDDIAGGKMKEAGYTNWIRPNTGATNESGFSSLPAGNRSFSTGSFCCMGENAYFWSSTESNVSEGWSRLLHYGSSGIGQSVEDKTWGYSVRCVKDE